MKSKEKKLLREKSLNELKSMVKSAKNTIFTSKLDKVQNKLKNTKSIFMKRKEVALMLTIIREKELFEKGQKA